VIEPTPGLLSSAADLLPTRQCDERIGLTRSVADALDDPRNPDLIDHTLDDLAYLMTGLCGAWPDVILHFRGDEPAGTAAALHRGAVAGRGTRRRDNSTDRPAGRGRSACRGDECNEIV
jgi:hypothetical protein